MDLTLYIRVLWRFRMLVLFGLVLAFSLALLSFVRVSFDEGAPTLSYRKAEAWQSESTLLVTQRGRPWTRITTSPETGEQLSDPFQFSKLALFYSTLANSDAVRELIRRQGPVEGEILAQPTIDKAADATFPIIRMTGTAETPRAAIRLAERGSAAFRSYLAAQQSAAGIPDDERVVVQVLNRARGAQLIEGRKRTTPIFVFLAVICAVVGIVSILENLRPRIRVIGSERDWQAGASSRGD